jgi:hypothetical protein
MSDPQREAILNRFEVGYTGSYIGGSASYDAPIYNIFDPKNVQNRFRK